MTSTPGVSEPAQSPWPQVNVHKGGVALLVSYRVWVTVTKAQPLLSGTLEPRNLHSRTSVNGDERGSLYSVPCLDEA